MKLLLVLGALLGLSGGADAVMEIAQMAIYGLKITNTLDKCYFMYGTPLIGLRESSGAELIGETEWFDTCTLPWGRKEMEVFCRAFGWHTVEENWPLWDIYDSIFNVTDANSGAGCDVDADASMGDCDFGTRVTPACDGTTQDSYYSAFDDPLYKKRPIVFCQAGTDNFDPFPCLHEGDLVTFSEILYWKNDGLNRFDSLSERKKRDLSNSQFKIYKTDDNEIKKVAEVVAKRDRPVEAEDKKPLENLLLVDPLGLKTRFPVDKKTAKDIEAFWDLLDKFGVEHEDHIDETDTGDETRGKRFKRATLTDNFCGDPNLISVFKHYSECHCQDGYRDTFCERDVDECYPINPCNGTGVICRNTDGSYHCECVTGYQLAANQHECIDVDECSQGSPCESPRICRNTIGGYLCDCPTGYRHNQATGQCDDIIECDEGGCPQNCTNTPGSFMCSCFTGYEIQNDQRSCDDIDECEDDGNCDLATSTCQNTYGSFRCDCKIGFELGSGGLCEDINECNVSNPCPDGRSNCVNNEGSYICSCPDGLQEDQWGVCVQYTDMTVRVPMTFPSAWDPAFADPSSVAFKAICDETKRKAEVENAFISFNLASVTCEVSEATAEVTRKKRQAQTNFNVDLLTSFAAQLDLAQQSQVTFTMQENLASGSQTIVIANFGSADITNRAKLIKAEGVNLNDTDNEITEVCYLYNLLDYCLEGSVCVETGNNMPTCDCDEGFTGEQCNEQVVSALSTSTIFLLAACIGLFFALLGLCCSHMYHMRKLHALERFVGYRYHMMVMNDERYTRGPSPNRSAMNSSLDRPRSWLPQPVRRHNYQSPAYFSHWS